MANDPETQTSDSGNEGDYTLVELITTEWGSENVVVTDLGVE